MGFFIWQEARLGSAGFSQTHVLSYGSKTKWVCRRQNEPELQRILQRCEKSGLTTVSELRAFVKNLPKEPALTEGGLDDLFAAASGETGSSSQLVPKPAAPKAADFQPASTTRVAEEPAAVAEKGVKENQEASESMVAAAKPASEKEAPQPSPPTIAAAKVIAETTASPEGQPSLSTPAPAEQSVTLQAPAHQADGDSIVETPAKKPRVDDLSGSSSQSKPFEYSIWGSPKKKSPVVVPGSSKKVKKSGNPDRLTYERADNCSVCKLVKIPEGMPEPVEQKCKTGRKRVVKLLHHGSRCHFCQIKIQFFQRKYGVKSTSLAAFTEMQVGHIKAESMAYRAQVLGHH